MYYEDSIYHIKSRLQFEIQLVEVENKLPTFDQQGIMIQQEGTFDSKKIQFQK